MFEEQVTTAEPTPKQPDASAPDSASAPASASEPAPAAAPAANPAGESSATSDASSESAVPLPGGQPAPRPQQPARRRRRRRRPAGAPRPAPAAVSSDNSSPEAGSPDTPAEAGASPATPRAPRLPRPDQRNDQRNRHRQGPPNHGGALRGALSLRSAPREVGPAPTPSVAQGPDPRYDWRRVARTLLVSRTLDELEETRLHPAKKILYQFSARGHELAQILLATQLIGPHDAVSGYYRSRPLLLTLGLSPADALAGGMGKCGSVSEGRDIGAVYNLPASAVGANRATVLPMAGGVGTQYTTTAGWAKSILYRRDVLGDASYRGAIAVVLGGEASVATNGFWSALTLATTQRLPMLFLIEDNGYGISVPSSRQTPGGNIAKNLASFANLRVWDGDGTDPADVVRCLAAALAAARGDRAPALVRLAVPRLSGHSGQDSQAYKSPELLAAERNRDPLPRLHDYLVPAVLSTREWNQLETEAKADVAQALREAESRPDPDPATLRDFLFAPQPPIPTVAPETSGARVNMVDAIRRTLESELRANPALLVFGEDVGPKGGVHTATLGLQSEFGPHRVHDTSLSEEGIIGSAVGLALNGLRPVAEIQFRKYADPATEQLNDCGTLRWRTHNRFTAPIVVRMPGGFFKCGDPWHSLSSEVTFVHAFGWQVAYPSNAADAVGLLRSAMRSPNPTIFFEHRSLLDASSARRPYPGDAFQLPFGQAALLLQGDGLTLVTWGAMVERCLEACTAHPGQVDLLDLRTLMPWDREAVLASVRRTSKLLIVHEDTLTAGFGAEIAAVAAQEAFLQLDAPIQRLAVADVPLPYNVGLLQAALPSVEQIASEVDRLLNF